MDHQAFAELLGNYGEFVGAIAVVVTLGYLAVQIKQNTRATKNASAETMMVAAQNTALALGSSNEVASIWVRGLTDYSSLDADEQARMHFLLLSQILTSDSMYWSYRVGNLDEELWERQSSWMKTILQSEAGKDVLRVQREAKALTKAFLEHCDTIARE
jgi:hypothetical protein